MSYLTPRQIFDVLTAHDLLREAVVDGTLWTLSPDDLPDVMFDMVTYDSRTSTPTSVLFCKGAFKPEYLAAAVAGPGLGCYVAETEYSSVTTALGFVVTDVRKAMSLLGATFYGNPQNDLTLVGITGTKGKTTTSYLVHALLAAHTGGKTALMSSEQTILDGKTPFESELTTPESLDLFRMMREAVTHGMTHLVMEVSSQAYKINRVYGLTFDVGAFLNISPDHISPIEHPTFEDYFYSKRELITNSRNIVLNRDLPAFPLLEQTARLAGSHVTTYGMGSESHADLAGVRSADGSSYDVTYTPGPDIPTISLGKLHLRMEGDVNYSNALAALAMGLAAGVSPTETTALEAINTVTVPGRMEKFVAPDGVIAYVDYAHNYLSLKQLLDFAHETYPDADITVVTGSAGGKALDRREGLATAASEGADALILTCDDPDFETAHDIATEMAGYVTNPDLDVHIIDDRAEAITFAFERARKRAQVGDGQTHVILVVGKGDEKWIKVQGRHVPYASDHVLVERLTRKVVNE